MGENENEANLEKRVEVLSANYNNVKREIRQLSNEAAKNKATIQDLKLKNGNLQVRVDSLGKVTDSITNIQSSDKTNFNKKLNETNTHLASNHDAIINRTIWGIAVFVVIIFLLIVITYFILKRIKKGATSIEATIDEVRKTQDSLQTTQTKLQEDSIKLDNKLLEIAQRQMDDEKKQPTVPGSVPDHSLALKVADEIARIEMNMSRMDPSVKGFKQLKKAVERMKDNFKANGYEIADMLGKPYNEGMRVNADFVIDESLKSGERIITGVTKPQVVFNGELIQKATIKVSQNI